MSSQNDRLSYLESKVDKLLVQQTLQSVPKKHTSISVQQNVKNRCVSTHEEILGLFVFVACVIVVFICSVYSRKLKMLRFEAEHLYNDMFMQGLLQHSSVDVLEKKILPQNAEILEVNV